ncbi:MAG: glycerol-3-phosphate dehydrogenase C-terminal domain-containing protein, partial [Pseudolabrys sp.]
GHFFGAMPSWTASSKLPGGEFSPDEFEAQVSESTKRWPFLSTSHVHRLMRAYGLRAERFLGDAKSMDDLGQCFAGDLTAAEVRYMVENEWAQNADDVLWRRSKIGLKATTEGSAALDRFIVSLGGKAAMTAR